MTYREKLQMEHPEQVTASAIGGCVGCPWGHGYEDRSSAPCQQSKEIADQPAAVRCTNCWDRVIPCTEDKKYENWTRDELMRLIRVYEAREEAHDKAEEEINKTITKKAKEIEDLKKRNDQLTSELAGRIVEIIHLKDKIDDLNVEKDIIQNSGNAKDREINLLKYTIKDREEKLKECQMKLAVYRTQAMQTYGTCIFFRKDDINILVQKNKEIEEFKKSLEFERAHKDYWYNECHNLSKKVCERDDTIQRLEKELKEEKKEHAKHHGFLGYFHVE